MSTSVASLLSKATILLQDSGNVRWSQDELLSWLNEGQRALVVMKPNAYVKVEPVQLAAGTKQTLPVDAIVLLDIPRNMGTTGTTVGAPVRATSREFLDVHVPTWHSATASATVKHFMYSLREPRVFYVYPPQPTSGRGYVDLYYSAIPPNSEAAGNLQMDDQYAHPLLNYIMFRAYSKDAEFAANAQLAASYYQQFVQLVGGNVASEAAVK